MKRFRGWRYRALLAILGQLPAGRAVLSTQWMDGYRLGVRSGIASAQLEADLREHRPELLASMVEGTA